MKNVAVRALFGAIYVGIIVFCVLYSPTMCLILLFLLGGLAVNEFLTITTPLSESKSTSTDMIIRSLDCAGALILIVTVWLNFYTPGVACWLVYLIVRLCLQLWVTDRNAITSLALSLMSQLYIALPIALMSVPYRVSPAFLLLLFVLVWVNDTFAFITGCTLGRHRLWERVSPKKSWEGFFGGAIFTVAASVGAAWFMPHLFLDLGHMCALGIIVTIAATLGDLIESMIKRTLGVKDSGRLIPGHGGILDRIDSLLLVIPASVVYLLLLVF